MASHVVPGPARSRKLPHAIVAAVVAAFALITIASVIVLTACSHNQAAPPPPIITTPTVVTGSVIPCPSGFYSNSTTPAVCHSANLAGCPDISNLDFTYSYDNPGSPKGTIVFFTGGGGNTGPGDLDFSDFYFGQGYEIVQVQWSDDWEYATIPPQFTGNNDSTTHTANVQLAACRPATFLNFVFNTSNTSLYGGGGRCAQGASAGSAAIAYSMTFYGAQNYLDAVEFESGPPLADIKQGCEVPNNIQIQVCGDNGGNQFGCKLGGTSPWQLSPIYTDQVTGIRNATNDNSCANGQTTSAASNAAWLKQSLVNDGTNNPTYSYPHTAMTAWLCQSVLNNNQCTGGFPGDGGQGGSPADDCPNNSSSQAQIYFSRLTNDPNHLPQAPYAIYAVQNCDTSEGVNGVDATVAALNNDGGTDAIEQDMIKQCVQH
ncbi:MAG: hypothetical protein WCA16_01835 [Candidatus Sulfotelmatobacter sp.]